METTQAQEWNPDTASAGTAPLNVLVRACGQSFGIRQQYRSESSGRPCLPCIHSETLPCMSCSSQAFGVFSPTGCVSPRLLRSCHATASIKGEPCPVRQRPTQDRGPTPRETSLAYRSRTTPSAQARPRPWTRSFRTALGCPEVRPAAGHRSEIADLRRLLRHVRDRSNAGPRSVLARN